MTIYGVALLAFYFLLGKILGNLFGFWLGIGGDVGGVGFAMVLLIIGNLYLDKRGLLETPTLNGIMFWGSMYIPIIIAMSATQNVKAAISNGPVAIIAGAVVTVAAFFLVPLISSVGRTNEASNKGGDD